MHSGTAKSVPGTGLAAWFVTTVARIVNHRPGGWQLLIEQQGPHTDPGAVFRCHQKIVLADAAEPGQYARVFIKNTALFQVIRQQSAG